ncbi:MAG: NAD(+)/NADH kinase [Candidatus Thermoplasmatota archaeon]|nr:NAD(+)/NADH kinase [Candidatus Thermoplasmatota archaeon]MCL5731114.1 NAD(+)/NADH kinase [Candidatus Thermoplasmatota archaeon]
MKTVALLVNPVAASGKQLGIKTSDCMPEGSYSSETIRTGQLVMKSLASMDGVTIVTPDTGFPDLHIQQENVIMAATWRRPSSRDDTKAFVRQVCRSGTDLLMFVGGDGTARDIMESCQEITVIGVPSGIKMYSSVFALTWQDAVVEAEQFLLGNLSTEKKEIIDFSFELNVPVIYGYMNGVRSAGLMQDPKMVYGNQGEDAIAEEITGGMQSNVSYIIGPGTTCNAILEKLGIESRNLLNFKIVRDRMLISDPASENDMFESMQHGDFQFILSPIGGMGVLIGRGNYELSPRIMAGMNAGNTVIIGTAEKISGLRELIVIVPEKCPVSLGEHVRIVTGIDEYAIRRIRVVRF